MGLDQELQEVALVLEHPLGEAEEGEVDQEVEVVLEAEVAPVAEAVEDQGAEGARWEGDQEGRKQRQRLLLLLLPPPLGVQPWHLVVWGRRTSGED